MKNEFVQAIKRIYFIAGFIFLSGMAKTAPIDSLTAKTVALNFYSDYYRVNVRTISLARSEPSASGGAAYYIFNINTDSGFVIIAADDAAHPLLGYSNEGGYYADHVSPEFNYWMLNDEKQIDYMRLHNITATEAIQNEWRAYKNNELSALTKRTNTVSPLVETIWAQSPYYNSLCPNGALAGCVATAMGQIMKYWKYPPHGIDSSSYTANPYGTLKADYDTTQYLWGDMPENVVNKNTPVALLTYDCGVSVQMAYSDTSSGSYMLTNDYPVSAQSAFVNYFGYNSSTIQGLYYYDYSQDEWMAIIENELNSGRPFQYAGSGNQGSHSWVCDGYDENENLHMNWGWGGYEDGYFNQNLLNPANIPFNLDQEILIGIQPAPAVAWFTASPLVIWAGDTIQFTDKGFGYSAITNWQWMLPGAVTPSSASQNPLVVYNTAGNYSVSETVYNSDGGNTLTRNGYITVLQNNVVNVYPSVNNGTFTARLRNSSYENTNLFFSLYTMLGQKVYTTTLEQFKTQLSVTLPPGMYIFRAMDASGTPVSSGRMVIAK